MSALANRQTIVAGIDGSPVALAAARWAGAIAARQHVRLALTSVIPIPGPRLTNRLLAEGALRKDLRLTAESRLAAAATVLRADQSNLEVVQFVDHGDPAAVLVERSERALMVAVGHSPYSRVGTVVLGTSAIVVANMASCPVLVWRGRTTRPLPVTDRPVLVGVDGSSMGQAALGYAFELADLLDVGLTALHTWQGEGLGRWQAEPQSWVSSSEHEEAVLAECLAGWSQKYPNVAVARIVSQNEPTHMLLDRARDSQLVVVGSHGRNRVAGLLLGSTSQELLRSSPCPVLVCR